MESKSHELWAVRQPTPEDVRATWEADLRIAAREYEAELRNMFDRLPKWNTMEDGHIRHRYWNGQKWVEFDLNDPPLWVVENIGPHGLPSPNR